MDIITLLLCAVSLLLVASLLYILRLKDSHKKQLSKLKDVKKVPQDKSLELTDFIYDVNKYGYSFVRVDPASVFMRTPK